VISQEVGSEVKTLRVGRIWWEVDVWRFLDPGILNPDPDRDPVSGAILRLHMRIIKSILLAAAEVVLRTSVIKEPCLSVIFV